MVHRLINLGIGFVAVVPGIIMALGVWISMSEWPGLRVVFDRSAGAFIIIAIIAMLQSKKEVKKLSQFGIAVGFLWMMVAMLLELEL